LLFARNGQYGAHTVHPDQYHQYFARRPPRLGARPD
jgi:hypothetical protein